MDRDEQIGQLDSKQTQKDLEIFKLAASVEQQCWGNIARKSAEQDQASVSKCTIIYVFMIGKLLS